MKVIQAWDINANFWEINPQLKVPEIYNKLYLADKSKGKAQSSKLMWAIAFYADFDSKYRQMSAKEKQILINSDILKDEAFDWETIKEEVNAWEMFMPIAKKQLLQWERLMSEKTTFLRDLTYNADNAEFIEKLLLSNSKLYKEFEDITSRLTQSEEGGQMIGGGRESLSEMGEI